MDVKLREKIEGLKQRFTASLANRHREVTEAWLRLRDDRWDAQGIAALQLLAHRLAGNSALFGFPALGHAARALDECLDDIPPDAAPSDRLRVESHVAKLSAALLAPESPPPTKALGAEVTAVANDRPSIFLVDDDVDLTDLLSLQLTECGYRVAVFDSPSGCLAALSEQVPAVVVMDLGFPDGSLAGLDAVSEIRARSGEPIPVVFISARNDLDARLQALRAGSYCYLAKPFDFAALQAAVTGAISEAKAQALRVLVVDDDEDAAMYHAALLDSMNLKAEVLLCPNQTLQRVHDFKPDVVLIDLLMPGVGGDELAILVTETQLDRGCAVVMLTAHESETARTSAVRAGVSSYLTKPVSQSLLVETIRGASRAARRRAARVRAVTQHGTDTPVLQRPAFLARLEDLVGVAKPEAAALIYLGIDQAESIVRQHGSVALVALHEQLLTLAESAALPGEPWTALGDTVLAILVKNACEAAVRAEHLRTVVANTPFQLDSRALRCTASLAVVPLGAELTSLRACLALAERTEREARRAGGNRVNALSLVPTQQAAQAVEDIDDIVARTVLGLQPVVSIDSDQPTLFDALLRLRDASGVRPAQQFLPSLIARGHGRRLDRRVVELGLDFLASGTSAPLSIRLTRDSLDDAATLDELVAFAASRPTAAPRQLLVQLDEEWLALHPETAARVVGSLRDNGLGLLLTNYGTSKNADVLSRFGPFAYARLAEALDQSAIAGLIEAAGRAGARLIASHVEDAKRLSQLWSMGVRLFQGNFIEQPRTRN